MCFMFNNAIIYNYYDEVILPLYFKRPTCNCNLSQWKTTVPTSASPTVSAVGHSHGDVPQQAHEEQAAGDSFPPRYPF